MQFPSTLFVRFKMGLVRIPWVQEGFSFSLATTWRAKEKNFFSPLRRQLAFVASAFLAKKKTSGTQGRCQIYFENKFIGLVNHVGCRQNSIRKFYFPSNISRNMVKRFIVLINHRCLCSVAFTKWFQSPCVFSVK